MSWRASVPDFLPGEEASWKCVAQRRQPDGVWLAAGDLYVTQRRLILQAPRWARPARRVTLSYDLADCTSFGRGDARLIGRSWASQVWKRMRLELENSEAVELAVRRPKKATEVISRAIDLADSDPEAASP